MNCPMCDAGIKTTRHGFLALVDPKTGIPTGEQLVVSEKMYAQLQQFAIDTKTAIITGKQRSKKR